jgi:hypothetical protein
MCGTAANFVDHVLPRVPVPPWVLTVPHEVRHVLALRPDALTAQNRIFVEEVARWQAHARGLACDETGASPSSSASTRGSAASSIWPLSEERSTRHGLLRCVSAVVGKCAPGGCLAGGGARSGRRPRPRSAERLDILVDPASEAERRSPEHALDRVRHLGQLPRANGAKDRQLRLGERRRCLPRGLLLARLMLGDRLVAQGLAQRLPGASSCRSVRRPTRRRTGHTPR